MMHPGMHGAGIDQMRHAHLFNMPEPLKPGMRYDMHDLFFREPEEAIDGIINDFYFQGG
jgi:hypothetical protein